MAERHSALDFDLAGRWAAAEPRLPWSSRLGWLLVIWAGSVATLFLVAWLLRLLMRGAGMST